MQCGVLAGDYGGDCRRARGRLGMVVRDQSHGWSIESKWFHRPNVVSCVVINRKCTPIISTYLPPSTLEHLLDLGEDLTRFRYQDHILLGGFNVFIQSQNPHIHQVADMLMDFRLVDLWHHLGMMAAPTHENLVSGAARTIFLGKMWLHLWDRSVPLQHGGNKVSNKLCLRALCPVG